MTAAICLGEAGRMDGLALGWVVIAADHQTPPFRRKSGGTGGFMSYIAFVPRREVGVFVAVNLSTLRCFRARPRRATSCSRTSRRAFTG